MSPFYRRETRPWESWQLACIHTAGVCTSYQDSVCVYGVSAWYSPEDLKFGGSQKLLALTLPPSLVCCTLGSDGDILVLTLSSP